MARRRRAVARVVASLWRSYFDREDRRAADKLVAAEPEERSRMGILGYWYAHLALISGIVLIAAGIRQLLEGHSGMRLLAGGMVLFMLGDVFFRWVMGMHPIAVRCFGAVLAVALGFAGTRWERKRRSRRSLCSRSPSSRSSSGWNRARVEVHCSCQDSCYPLARASLPE